MADLPGAERDTDVARRADSPDRLRGPARVLAPVGRWLLGRPHVLILLALGGLFLYGIAREAIARHSASWDETLFINVGHGVLSHGYPFETVHVPTGTPFYDHTPLYGYFMTLPAALDTAFGMHVAVVSGRLMSAAFGLATLVLAYYTARDVRGTVAGIVTASLIATNPFFAQLSWTVHMEVPTAFFLVLGLYFLVHERMWQAGLAIAAAVMLKEHALAFWLAAGVYVLVVRGWRDTLKVTVPTAVAGAAWAIAAYLIDAKQFRFVLNRWLMSAGTGNAVDSRFRISWRRWLKIVTIKAIGPPLAGAVLVTAGALVRRARVPAIGYLPAGYAALAIIASFLIHLKEDRWLILVIPMTALAVGMLADWNAIGRWIMRLDARHDAQSGTVVGP